MSLTFHFDAGPISIDVQLDDSGIHFKRAALGRNHAESIPWDKITGATLVRPAMEDAAEEQKDERMAQFMGPQAVQKFHELQGKVGQIFVAYRDEKNRLQETEIPALLTDAAYLQEFQTRLGSRWLGETQTHDQVGKKLHTNPGFFKTIFVLVTLLGILAFIAAIGLAGFLGPILNFMSIQKMLLDLQDGNYTNLGYRLATYVALFVLGFFLHRVIRARLDAMKRTRSPRPSFRT
jgi:hypothetical protein